MKNNYNTYTDEYLYHYFKVVSSKDQAISHDLFSTFMKAYEEEKAACTEVSMCLLSGISRTIVRRYERCGSIF